MVVTFVPSWASRGTFSLAQSPFRDASKGPSPTRHGSISAPSTNRYRPENFSRSSPRGHECSHFGSSTEERSGYPIHCATLCAIQPSEATKLSTQTLLHALVPSRPLLDIYADDEDYRNSDNPTSVPQRKHTSDLMPSGLPCHPSSLPRYFHLSPMDRHRGSAGIRVYTGHPTWKVHFIYSLWRIIRLVIIAEGQESPICLFSTGHA